MGNRGSRGRDQKAFLMDHGLHSEFLHHEQYYSSTKTGERKIKKGEMSIATMDKRLFYKIK